MGHERLPLNFARDHIGVYSHICVFSLSLSLFHTHTEKDRGGGERERKRERKKEKDRRIVRNQ